MRSQGRRVSVIGTTGRYFFVWFRYRQSYNAQSVVDAEGSQLVLGTRVSRCASDANELVADIESIPEELGRPETVVADNGFANQAEVERLEVEDAEGKRIEVLVSMGAEGRQRRYDFRPRRRTKARVEREVPGPRRCTISLRANRGGRSEPRRDSRRLISLSQAAMADPCSV